jgi:hypothetical protein
MLGALALDGGTAATLECSSHALVLERLAGCSFDAALFLNLSHEHLDFHRDMDEYFEAKVRLFGLLKPEGKAVVNLGDEYGRRLASRLVANRIVGFFLEGEEGIEQTRPAALGSAVAAAASSQQLFATVLGRATLGLDGTTLEVKVLAPSTFEENNTGAAAPLKRERTGQTEILFSINSPLLGRPNAENLLAAAATGVALGFAPEEIAASSGRGRRRPRPPRADRERPGADGPRRLRPQASRPRGRAEDRPPSREGGRRACSRRLRLRRRPRQGQAPRHGPHRGRARRRRRRHVRQPALRESGRDHRGDPGRNPRRDQRRRPRRPPRRDRRGAPPRARGTSSSSRARATRPNR